MVNQIIEGSFIWVSWCCITQSFAFSWKHSYISTYTKTFKSKQHILKTRAALRHLLLFDPPVWASFFRVWEHLSSHRRRADLLHNLRSPGDPLVRVLAGRCRGPVGNYFWEGHRQSGEDDCGEKQVNEWVCIWLCQHSMGCQEWRKMSKNFIMSECKILGKINSNNIVI